MVLGFFVYILVAFCYIYYCLAIVINQNNALVMVSRHGDTIARGQQSGSGVANSWRHTREQLRSIDFHFGDQRSSPSIGRYLSASAAYRERSELPSRGRRHRAAEKDFFAHKQQHQLQQLDGGGDDVDLAHL